MIQANEPAFPYVSEGESCFRGLTKRELACIELRIPETGNEWLDQLIAKAQRRDVAREAMQGLLPITDGMTFSNIATKAVLAADALIAELSKEK